MNALEEKTLFECLQYAHVSCIPEPLKSDNIVWLRAIAKVWKNDNSRNYCIVENDGYNKPKVVRGFGRTAAIVKFEGIFPYTFLNDSYLPSLQNRKEIKMYLINNGLDEKAAQKLLTVKGKSELQLAEDNQKIIDLVYYVAIKKNLHDLSIIEDGEE